MKIKIKFFFLAIALAFVAGCAGLVHHPDPLAGWKMYFHEPTQAITDDYKDYIQQLPPKENMNAGMVQYFEDGTGKIAVKIEVPLNGAAWEHILIYSKDGKRIKVIKYLGGHYRS